MARVPITPGQTTSDRGPEPFDLRFVLLALVARYLDSSNDDRFVVLRDLEDTLRSYWDGPYETFQSAFHAKKEMEQFAHMREWYREIRLLMARAGFDGESDVRATESA